MGASDLAIAHALLDGEHDSAKLLELCHSTIRHKKAKDVIEALRGTWEPEHLFALRQELQSWEHYQRQIAECDQQIFPIFSVKPSAARMIYIYAPLLPDNTYVPLFLLH